MHVVCIPVGDCACVRVCVRVCVRACVCSFMLQVVTRFNNACRTVFQALAVYTPHDLKISTTTAVIVTTPSVFRSLDYATLTRRIKTIVLDHVHPNFLPDILSLPPLYDPKSSEEEPARQIVAFLDYQQEARTIMRHYGKAGMPSPSVLHFPFFASKYLKGAASLKHSFLQAETEKAALVALVQEMRVLRPDNFKPVGILAPATVPRVLVVLSGAMAGKDAQHVVAVLKRPRLAIPSLKKTWFKETTVGDILTSKKNTGDIFKEYDHKNLHVLVTSESLIHDIRYKQVDAVVFFGMPHPRNYFCACRLFLQESKIGKTVCALSCPVSHACVKVLWRALFRIAAPMDTVKGMQSPYYLRTCLLLYFL